MFEISNGAEPGARHRDAHRGAQRDLIVRGSGFLSILGALVALVLSAFYPPTAQIGAIGWALVVPASLLGVGAGIASLTLRHRPSMRAIHASSFTGLAQVGGLEWLAGGGRAPYMQLLMLPMIGSAAGQPLRRCLPVIGAAGLVAATPFLYGPAGGDAGTMVTEFALLSSMTVMIAIVVTSTRTHRARLEDASEQANVLAHVDPLTGMPNRRSFEEALESALGSPEPDGAPVSLLLCDVDSFKQINDNFGHAAGDEALQAIGEALAGSVRKPDVAFRWAGDEFAVILRDSDAAAAEMVARRVRETVATRCRRPDGRPISLAVGVAELASGMTTDEVLAAADKALFCQKQRRAHLRGVA